jgi:hypothetical protein
MSDTPRTKAATRMAFSSEHRVEIEAAQKLEHELIVMKAQFAEYVKAEDAWRDEFDTEKSDDLRIVASKLRIQAMQTLAALKGGSHE